MTKRGTPTHYPCGHPRTPENTATRIIKLRNGVRKNYLAKQCRKCEDKFHRRAYIKLATQKMCRERAGVTAGLLSECG